MPESAEEPDRTGSLVRALIAEFDSALGSPERAAGVCRALGEPGPIPAALLPELGPLLARRAGPVALPLFELLAAAADAAPEPWPWLRALAAARDPALARRGLELAAEAARTGRLVLTAGEAEELARTADPVRPVFAEPPVLDLLAAVLAGRGDPDRRIRARFAAARDPALRLLLARVLDRGGGPAPPEAAPPLLGKRAAEALAPYLAYTRAGYADLAGLAARPGQDPPCLAPLLRAEAAIGEARLREAVAALGWGAVSLGLTAETLVPVRVDGSFPFFVPPADAPILDALGRTETGEPVILVTAHGGDPAPAPAGEGRDRVARFRALNLVHAELLASFLDLAPLDADGVRRILGGMDRAAAEFTALFAEFTDEASVLPAHYAGLRGRVVELLEREGAGAPLSPELTRLVQRFEEPRTVAEAGSLHGLKRYLHQRGLRLGFRLVDPGRSTSRTVTLLMLAEGRRAEPLRPIRYADFEPESVEIGAIPHPVRIAARAHARQLLAGRREFPDLRVFCYGNEVHYYFSFGAHPALLRVDFSPPHRGGMVDLEYYGVSKSELADHPNPALDAVRAFFRRLGFDVAVESTRVHARYDKERTADLGDLCAHAGAALRLVPHLMDLDWTVGDLDLSPAAREAVTGAWADRFARWGALPIEETLTADRRGISLGTVETAAGRRELRWDGEGAYRDRFGPGPSRERLARLDPVLVAAGLDPGERGQGGGEPLGQLALEAEVLEPLHAAPRSGPAIHEAVRFAELLAGPREAIADAIAVAGGLAPVERLLRFRATGGVNGHPVERARLPLRDRALPVFVLREPGGKPALARVEGAGDARAVLRLLRESGYVAAEETPPAFPAGDPEALRAAFRRENPHPHPRRAPGEVVLEAVPAAPGRATGPVRFGTAGRAPAELAGAVLVADALRPEDAPYLFRATAVVSTGGGTLSHAGLLAAQFGKPAVLVPGCWRRGADAPPALALAVLSWTGSETVVAGSRVSVRRHLREHEHLLREGDLVTVDAGEGELRVLGQDPEALALHEELRRLVESGSGGEPGDPARMLSRRGERLRARHQLERLLGRLGNPALARHAVRELLDEPSAGASGRDALFRTLLANPAVQESARATAAEVVGELERRGDALRERARARIPTARTAYEVVALHAGAARVERLLDSARAALGGPDPGRTERRDPGAANLPGPAAASRRDPGAAARDRLAVLRAEAWAELVERGEDDPRARHRLRRVERTGAALGEPPGPETAAVRERTARRDVALRTHCRNRMVLRAAECGFALHPAIGWKAANLGEMERLAGGGLTPPWFVLTQRAFTAVLASPPPPAGQGAVSLAAAIRNVLENSRLDPEEQARRIRVLLETVELPPALARETADAYAALGAAPGPFVAVRSSAREEDTESAARAGEFDTFLYVRGGESLIEHVKRAWSGLWTARAIHRRRREPDTIPPGGGIVVQRIVDARVSGVLQTVNVAGGEPGELVLNAGLGLGEGVVSGLVAADRATVDKASIGAGALRFRYVTADKRERVVFDAGAGRGTVREETLYHQRLRPALEYVELWELVNRAASLEADYGYPLDLEFALEGSRLWILQVRPVAAGDPGTVPGPAGDRSLARC